MTQPKKRGGCLKIGCGGLLGLFVLSAIIGAIGGGADTEPEVLSVPPGTTATTAAPPPPDTSPPTTSDGTMRVTGSNWIGCQQKETYEQLTSYAAQGDEQAWKTALAQAAAIGDCIFLENGQRVFLEDTSGFLASMVQIRPEGRTATYWTANEAVD